MNSDKSASAATKRHPFRDAAGWSAVSASLAALVVGTGTLQAQSLSVPNASFESPGVTGVVSIPIDDWQKIPKPDYFDEAAFGFQWVQTAGLFANTAAGQPDHIDNLDGNQSAYLLAFPQVTLSQDLTSPTAKFQTGVAYDLTVGLLGKGMADGNNLTLSLYYRDGGNNPVTVASMAITYTAASLPSGTHLTDFTLHVPAVQAGDAWAGQAIGVNLESTFGTGAGYWDLDNVRLTGTAVPEPGPLPLLGLGLAGSWVARRFLRRQV